MISVTGKLKDSDVQVLTRIWIDGVFVGQRLTVKACDEWHVYSKDKGRTPKNSPRFELRSESILTQTNACSSVCVDLTGRGPRRDVRYHSGRALSNQQCSRESSKSNSSKSPAFRDSKAWEEVSEISFGFKNSNTNVVIFSQWLPHIQGEKESMANLYSGWVEDRRATLAWLSVHVWVDRCVVLSISSSPFPWLRPRSLASCGNCPFSHQFQAFAFYASTSCYKAYQNRSL